MNWEPLFWGVVITGAWVGSVCAANDAGRTRGFNEAWQKLRDKEKQGQLGRNT